jgi:alpha-N-arabinofuranosidase
VIATIPVKGITPDVINDHYYKRGQGMFAEARHYDNTERNGSKIFVGEWATREGTPTPNFGAALGDAAFLTGLERNSDVVIMSAYAPLLVNVNPGGMQWSSDLIGYDALTSYGSPSYYTQVMFACPSPRFRATSAMPSPANRSLSLATFGVSHCGGPAPPGCSSTCIDEAGICG